MLIAIAKKNSNGNNNLCGKMLLCCNNVYE